MRKVSALLAAVWSICLIAGAGAAERTFGPFTVDDGTPEIIRMDGEIDTGAALSFRRALQAAPNAKLVTLNSPGGSVQMGLLIADDIHQRQLSTYIPKRSGCYSACSFIFLAGRERKADGELGVHQISNDTKDLVGAQYAISDIIEVLNRFGTPVDVMHIMFRTPPDDMYVFSQEEIERYGLNRTGGTSIAATPQGGAFQSPAPEGTAAAGAVVEAERGAAAVSALEAYTRQPNRMAIYTGLDLFGDDITSIRTSDAGACAENCLRMDGQCKAFTFNTDQSLRRGPNCFLKASSGRADGNSVALSGHLLAAGEADPKPMTLATIDPNSSLFENVDLPGGDLSRRPYPGASSPLACRLACIDNNACIAFTYVKAKKECWLKSVVGKPAYGKGMISGVKKIETFRPAKIISLN